PLYISLQEPRPPPSSTVFPYTTLFRSDIDMVWLDHHAVLDLANRHRRMRCEQLDHLTAMSRRQMLNDYESRTALRRHRREKIARSEDHTSELQSRFDLVCRLLLEKKKI